MAKFKKGDPKPEASGIKKGQKQAKTQAWDQLGEFLVDAGAQRYLTLISKLSDDDFINRYEHLLEYFKPKLQRSEVKADLTSNGETVPIFQFNNLNEE